MYIYIAIHFSGEKCDWKAIVLYITQQLLSWPSATFTKILKMAAAPSSPPSFSSFGFAQKILELYNYFILKKRNKTRKVLLLSFFYISFLYGVYLFHVFSWWIFFSIRIRKTKTKQEESFLRNAHEQQRKFLFFWKSEARKGQSDGEKEREEHGNLSAPFLRAMPFFETKMGRHPVSVPGMDGGDATCHGASKPAAPTCAR